MSGYQRIGFSRIHHPRLGVRVNHHLNITLLLGDINKRDMNGRAMGKAAIMRTADLNILFMNEYVKNLLRACGSMPGAVFWRSFAAGRQQTKRQLRLTN